MREVAGILVFTQVGQVGNLASLTLPRNWELCYKAV